MELTVAVTGGGRGIGLAIARAFAANGARVVIGDLDLDAATDAADGIGARAHVLDVREPASFAEFLAAVGPCDVLVNNAGVVHAATFLDSPHELRELQLAVNLHGVVNGMAAALPAMVVRGSGHVVNVASLAGRIATPGAAIYTATKFAVVGLTEAVRAEIHHTGVRVSAVLPTFVRTEMTAGLGLTVPKIEADVVARTVVRVVRRGGPALVTVPRWLATAPRLAAFAPQAVLDVLRRRVAGRAGPDGTSPNAAYAERVRRQLGADRGR